ncbi:O-antigen polymerase [Bacillus sp. AFS088145]|uniref:O-antigen polymerase n=1 Tax=Bacillus sp. AFS088145 TaxID=2033514 RepID=UPI0015CF2BBA|nr:O-antigen polymerase [Bacillus sp. AFS088145]
MKIYKALVNPVSLFSSIWLWFTFLSCLGLWGIYVPSTKAILYILISTLFFSVISFITYLRCKEIELIKKKHDIDKGKIKYVPLIVINFVSIIWLIPILVKTIPLLFAGEWQLVRFYYLNANTIHVIFNTKQALVCQWLVFPVFYVTTIISAYLVAKKKSNITLIIISMSGILMAVLVTAGRNALFKCLLFYVLAFLINSKRLKEVLKRIKESNIFIKILIVLGIAAMIFISSQRSLSKDTSALQNAVYYFTGPIVYFSYIIENPENFALNGSFLYGKATFGFITTPIEIGYSMLFGHDYAGADNIITTYVNQYINLSPSIKGNAISTALYPFMKDFGVLGIVLGPCIYAFIVNYVYANSKKNMFWNCLSIYMLYTVFFSEWQYELLFPQSFSIIVFLYIFLSNKSYKLKTI